MKSNSTVIEDRALFTWETTAIDQLNTPLRWWSYIPWDAAISSQLVSDQPVDLSDLLQCNIAADLTAICMRARTPWLLQSGDDSIPEAFTDPEEFRVIELAASSPHVEPTEDWIDDPAPGQFILRQILPAHTIFGPNGHLVIDARNNLDNSIEWNSYEYTAEENEAGYDGLLSEEDAAHTAALAAIQQSTNKEQRDPTLTWNDWRYLDVVSCQGGYEPALIAAHHLIGTTPEWNAETYRQGMRRYIRQWGDPFARHPGP